MQIKLASRRRRAVESVRRMTFLSEILLVCRCLRGVDRHYRPRMLASGDEKAFTVSHISAQLFRTGRTGLPLLPV